MSLDEKIDVEKLFALVEEMLCSALNDDWEQFRAVQLLQESAVQALFSNKKIFSLSEQDALKKVDVLFKQAIEIAESKKTEINQALLQFKKSQQVQKAYSKNI